MARRTCSVFLILAAAAACGRDLPTVENVVLISIDTCRADVLGCYGGDGGVTPNLDAFAAEGVLFETAFSPVPITMPAHSSLFTGLTPPHHGVRGNLRHQLDARHVTLAEMLGDEFSDSAGFISSRVLDRQFGISQGFDTWDDELVATRRSVFGAERTGGDTIDRAIDWLETRAGEPFLLFVHLYDPHEPYEPPEPYASRFTGTPYLGEVAYADAEIGRLLGALRRLSLEEATAVVVVGDHGELLGEHGELTHTYFVYHNAVRVPLIMRIPGIAGGQRVSGAVGLVDVAPTLCGLFNLPSPESDGRDLAPLLRGEAEGESERPLYCESLTPTRYGANPLRAVTTSSWKFIRSNRPELYDLAQDPEEAVNLVDERAGEMQRLQNILSGMVASEAGFEADADIGVDSETARQLAALGYMSSALDTDVDLDPRRPDPKDFIELHVAHQRTFLAMADGRWDEAEAACLEVLEGLPEFYEAVGNLAKIRVGQRRWGESLPLLERALELKPDQYEIIHDQGLALTEVGDLAGAVEAFRRAVALDPSPPTAELNLSRALFNVGALEEGLAHAETVAQHAAENPDMLRLLAELLLDHGQVAEAVPVLERVVALAPEDLETRNTLGLIMVSSGNLDVARRQYEAMVEIDPGSADAHLNLGMIILQQRQDEVSLRAAAVHFSRAAQLDPSLPAAHLNLAFANIRLGRTEEGIAGLRRTLDLVPDQPEVQDQLARLLITAADPSLRNPSEARDLAERACAISGYREPSFMATLAAAHAASGDTPRAAAVADRALGLAREQGRPELVRQLESDLASYR